MFIFINKKIFAFNNIKKEHTITQIIKKLKLKVSIPTKNKNIWYEDNRKDK